VSGAKPRFCLQIDPTSRVNRILAPHTCVVLGVGSRERHTEMGPDGRRVGIEGESEYTVNETAPRYSAGIEPGTPQDEAYARFPPRTPVRYGGWLDGIL
jgi:hypothetical protein